MATAEQIKALLRSHIDRDDQRFYATAIQVAAREARQGHGKLANDIKNIIEKLPKRDSIDNRHLIKSTPITTHSATDLGGLLELTQHTVRISELVLDSEILDRLHRVILEQRQADRLARFGLHPRRKLLFTGAPGTGKTMSASVLATELTLPLYTIVLDSLITRFMGETAAKLRLIFDYIKKNRAIYLFDEFDAIGTQRGSPNDVGEIRRVLNSFLLLVEQDDSQSLIIAATNHPELLDKALYRRFDDIIKFKKPNIDQIKKIIENKLAIFGINHLSWNEITAIAHGLSAAEISRACEDAAKEAVLHNNDKLSTPIVVKALKQRKSGNE